MTADGKRETLGDTAPEGLDVADLPLAPLSPAAASEALARRSVGVMRFGAMEAEVVVTKSSSRYGPWRTAATCHCPAFWLAAGIARCAGAVAGLSCPVYLCAAGH